MRIGLRSHARLAATAILSAALCAGLAAGAVAQKSDAKKSTMRQDHMRDHDQMSTSMDMDRDDRWNGLPVAPSYPEASPGNLDMNYWSDFTRRHMHSGNSYDTRVSRMDHDMRPMAEIRKEEIEELYPVAPSYPEADPAGLDMWCWMGIRKLHTRPGSAAEVAWIRRDLHMSHRLSTGPLWNDVEPIPAAPAYPEEAPGNLDLYHWKDWRRFRMSPGNAGDMRKREASNTQVQ